MIASTLEARDRRRSPSSAPGVPPELVDDRRQGARGRADAALPERRRARRGSAAVPDRPARRRAPLHALAARSCGSRDGIAQRWRRDARASVVLAVLAWFSVHRVVTERDAARAARADADAQRVKADARATELKAQTDRLTLAHARRFSKRTRRKLSRCSKTSIRRRKRARSCGRRSRVALRGQCRRCQDRRRISRWLPTANVCCS